MQSERKCICVLTPSVLFQTDLCGIKWRKLVCGDYNFSSEPLDDPVLASFSRCLAGDILCVWRRVAAQQPASASGPHSANQGTGGLFDPIGLPPGLGGPGGQNQQPPLSLHAAKELWIFWYGEEPDLSGLVAPELIAAGECCLRYCSAFTLLSAMPLHLHRSLCPCIFRLDFTSHGKRGLSVTPSLLE